MRERKKWYLSCLGVIIFALTSCSNFLFFPDRKQYFSPEDFGIRHDSHFLKTEDGVLVHLWVLQPSSPVKANILYFHGNGRNISSEFLSVAWLVDYGYRILVLDYRGYGQSEGPVGFPEVFNDLKAGFQFLEKQPGRKFVIGQSLGAALSIGYLGRNPEAQKNLDGIVLDASFASYSKIASEILKRNIWTWLLAAPVSWGMPGKEYDPENQIGKIKIPILLFHSKDDPLISYKNGQTLARKGGGNLMFVPSAGGHVQTFANVLFRNLTLDFLNRNGRPALPLKDSLVIQR